VSSLEKLKRKLVENPRGIRFSELLRVLRDLGYAESRQRGSHYVFRPSGDGPSVMIVKPHGGKPFCAAVDVKKVTRIIEEQEG